MAARDSNLAARFPNLDAHALKEIIQTDLAEEDLNNFLNMAYYTTRPLAGKLSACGGVAAEAAILKVMAAHFLTMYQQQPLSMSTLDWSVTYRGSDGQGLRGSSYGQQALALDCSGILAEESAGLRTARMEITTYYDITDDDDTKAVL